MMIKNFDFAATPHIHFGVGQRALLPDVLRSLGSRVLLVTGGASFDDSLLCQDMQEKLAALFTLYRESLSGEPSPAWVDDVVARYHGKAVDVVLAIGGGSAVDAGKAVAGLLPTGDSVMAYLEGVGEGKIFAGITTPLIAMPTTAGTGGETSKNAVLSVVGEHGFKKSFRDVSLVPQHIILDPELVLTCPAHVTAACGMDAFTQLLESYVSQTSSPMTDALAWSGLQRIRDGLLLAVTDGQNIEARSAMLYASSLSGLTLANAGLGSVHGLASPLGAFFPIPHGVACGALLYEAVRLNIEVMRERDNDNVALKKYADVGRLFSRNMGLNDVTAQDALLVILKSYACQLKMPKLSDWGVKGADIERLVRHISGGSMAGNPVVLTHHERVLLLQRVI
ncbi:MAG: iron-containing alcohol dehydrogenase [Mariprofundaceae bacterium]|nr:iron-containing alcohol dehydrogenase [Mariprofundaceae bacterium]